jgi:hypothetical protein
MTTISSVLPATISGYFTPPVGASLASLMSGSSSNSSGSISSTTDIFGTNSTANDPSGILNTLLTPSSTTTPTPSSASNAQSAYLAAQNVVSQSLSKLTA